MTTATRPIIWTPLPGMQTRFLARQEFEVLAGGAAGPGKTDCLVNDLRYFHQPWCHRLFVRRTITELGECIARSHKVVPAVFPTATWNESKKIWTFPSGATWRFSYCENMKDATRHQGAEYTELFVDELTQIHDEAIYLFLRSRVRSADPVAQQHLRVRATTNPGGPGHQWVKARWVDTCGRHGGSFRDAQGLWRAFIPGRLDENPYLDDAYRKNLEQLPKVLQQQLLDGDWEAGLHTAFPDLNDEIHFVEPFEIPDWWHQWGGHDWGFRHHAVTVHMCEDEHGLQYVVDTCWSRLKHPDQIAEAIWERLNVPEIAVIFCGPDIRYDSKARRGSDEHGKTVADQYVEAGLPIADASISRRAGYSHLLDLLSFRERGASGDDIVPRLRFMDTPGNRKLVHQLRSLIVDPDDPRDVLKVDADLLAGNGGDDGYDALRYGSFTRRSLAQAPEPEPPGAWDREVLVAEKGLKKQPFYPREDPLARQRRYLHGIEELGL